MAKLVPTDSVVRPLGRDRRAIDRFLHTSMDIANATSKLTHDRSVGRLVGNANFSDAIV